MSTHVVQIKKREPQIETELAIRDEILKYCPDVSFREVSNNTLAVLSFGGKIQFDIPLGSCILSESVDNITVEITIKEPYPKEVFKVANVKSDSGSILLLVSSVMPSKTDIEKRFYQILDTYNNTENLTTTELGRLWIIHEQDREKSIKVFEGLGEAKIYFGQMKENLMKVKVYQELRDQFLNPIPNNIKMEDL